MGISSGSYLGLGLEYNSQWGGRYFITEGEILTMMTALNLAYKVNDNLSLGGGINILYGSLTQKMNWNNNPLSIGSAPDGRIVIEDTDIGYGLNLSLLYEFSPSTRVGVLYMSEVDLDFEDAMSTSNLTDLPDYLLGDVEIDMTMRLPQSISISLFHQLEPQWAFLASVSWQEWSEFGHTDLRFAQRDGFTTDRNFDDTWGAGIGLHYQLSAPWKLMAGIHYDSSPVSDSNRTIDMPLDRQIRYAFGATYQYHHDLTLSAAYELIDAGSAKLNQTGTIGQGSLSGNFKTNAIHLFNINASWKF